MGFGLWLANLGEGVRKQKFVLDWVMSESRGNSMNISMSLIYREGRIEQR